MPELHPFWIRIFGDIKTQKLYKTLTKVQAITHTGICICSPREWMMLHEQEWQLYAEQNTLQTTLTPIHLSDSAGVGGDVMDALWRGGKWCVQAHTATQHPSYNAHLGIEFTALSRIWESKVCCILQGSQISNDRWWDTKWSKWETPPTKEAARSKG